MQHTKTENFRPTAVPTTLPVKTNDLSNALEVELALRCRGKVTKRLALKLAHAVISNDRNGIFLAEKLAMQLLPRLKADAAMKEIYLSRKEL